MKEKKRKADVSFNQKLWVVNMGKCSINKQVHNYKKD